MSVRIIRRGVAVAVAALLCVASAAPAYDRIFTVVGTGSAGFNGDGRLGGMTEVDEPTDLVSLSGGAVAFRDGGRVRVLARSGTVSSAWTPVPPRWAYEPSALVALSGGSMLIALRCGLPMRMLWRDGRSRAADASCDWRSLAALRDGSLLGAGGLLAAGDFWTPATFAVWRRAPDGRWAPFAGRGDDPGFSGDGGPAIAARLTGVSDMAEAADGAVLLADGRRVRRVAPDGSITTVAGTGAHEPSFGGDGGLATRAAISFQPGVAALPGGGFLLADRYNGRVRVVGRDEIIRTVAGDGTMFTNGPTGDGGPPLKASLGWPADVLLLAGGDVLVAEHARIRLLTRTGTHRLAIAVGAPRVSAAGVSLRIVSSVRSRLAVAVGDSCASTTAARMRLTAGEQRRLVARGARLGPARVCEIARTADGQAAGTQQLLYLGGVLTRAWAARLAVAWAGQNPNPTTLNDLLFPGGGFYRRYRAKGCRSFTPTDVACALAPTSSARRAQVTLRLRRDGRVTGAASDCGTAATCVLRPNRRPSDEPTTVWLGGVASQP